MAKIYTDEEIRYLRENPNVRVITHPASAIGHIGVIKMTTKFIGKAQPIMPYRAYIRIFTEITDLLIGIYLCHINTSAP